jgi:hypothetical protein
MTDPNAFWGLLRAALDEPGGAERLLEKFSPKDLVEYLLKFVAHNEAVLKTQLKLQLAKVLATGEVRCATTSIQVAPDDVQGLISASGEVVNAVSAYNENTPLTNPIIGLAASPPIPTEATLILRAIVAEKIKGKVQDYADVQKLLPSATTDGFLMLVRNHTGSFDDPNLQAAAQQVLTGHSADVRARAKRVVDVLEKMPAPDPPTPPQAAKRPAAAEAPDNEPVKRARTTLTTPSAVGTVPDGVSPDTLPPEGADAIAKTAEGKCPRVDGVPVMTTLYGGRCKGCPRRNIAGRTVIAPKDEPDGSSKWCCTLCVINKTSEAVHREVQQARHQAAATENNITSFF